MKTFNSPSVTSHTRILLWSSNPCIAALCSCNASCFLIFHLTFHLCYEFTSNLSFSKESPRIFLVDRIFGSQGYGWQANHPHHHHFEVLCADYAVNHDPQTKDESQIITWTVWTRARAIHLRIWRWQEEHRCVGHHRTRSSERRLFFFTLLICSGNEYWIFQNSLIN